MKHAIIGTGLIGTGIGLAALERGDAITAYNRTASKTKTLADAGANIASTVPRAVTGALFVHLALTADDAVDAV
ncbi:MAG: 3-hydroxyisobutyrate dehydrogenase, partial [Myxococcota bacterium]